MRRAGALVAVVVWLAACGGPPEPDVEYTDGHGPFDASPDAPAPCVPACAEGQRCIDGACYALVGMDAADAPVDTTPDDAPDATDAARDVGGDGRACIPRCGMLEVCVSGVCSCDPDRATSCPTSGGGTACVITTGDDPTACGGCGAYCGGYASGGPESFGVCRAGHCVCPMGSTQCMLTAPPGARSWVACYDLQTSLDACGACGHACGVGQRCEMGVCR